MVRFATFTAIDESLGIDPECEIAIEQQAFTQEYLGQSDARDKLKAELTKNWDYARV